MLLVGLMEPVHRYPESAAACLFARNIVARLFGNFVIFSPSFDSKFMPLADEVGRAAREATAVAPDHAAPRHALEGAHTHLVRCSTTTGPTWISRACRPGTTAATASGAPITRSSGTCTLYRHEPHKPVINLEAMYDGQGEKGWQAVDARSLAWRSWLSGAMGYTYGAGDMPPKCPQGSGGRVEVGHRPARSTTTGRRRCSGKAPSRCSTCTTSWPRSSGGGLEPAHELIRNQPDDVTRRMVLAKTAAGDLAVAYLPDNDAIEVDLSRFPAPLAARWFDPVRGRYAPIAGQIENKGMHRFAPPAKGDWVLLLQRKGG